MGRLLGVLLLRFTAVAGLHLDHKRSGAGLDNGYIRMLQSGSSRCRGAIGIDRLRCRDTGGNPRTLQACRAGKFLVTIIISILHHQGHLRRFRSERERSLIAIEYSFSRQPVALPEIGGCALIG